MYLEEWICLALSSISCIKSVLKQKMSISFHYHIINIVCKYINSPKYFPSFFIVIVLFFLGRNQHM